MKILESLFDHYIINARIRPALFVAFPIVALILVWIPESKGWGVTAVTIFATFGFFAFLSSAISNQGNKLQDKLYQKWGGEPTTSFLRHRDKTIDQHTKKRIHIWLQKRITGLKMASPDEEEKNPESADEMYRSAVHYLREKTRDKDKYKMVYSDLVAYGFARNSLVLKPIGFTISMACLISNITLIMRHYERLDGLIYRLKEQSIPFFFHLSAFAVSLVFLYVFGLLINSAFVKLRAERYAKSLLAVCDRDD